MGLLTVPEKIYDGATSLVDIIRRQFGDDIDGATQELVRQAGFPEPVARRIATGELPMDEANAARFGPSDPDSLLDFVQAKAYRQGDDIPDTSYRGGHTAPVDPEYNAPLHDLTGTYPEDVYSVNGPRYYGQGDELDEKSFEVIHEVRGNPDAPVTMYRAVPADAPDEIYPGDWVTTNPDYAVQHAGGHMEPSEYLDEQKWKVLEAETNAGRLRTDGNSPHEYGYTGNATVPLLGATALGSAGLLAAPVLMKDGVFQHTASETPIVERKEPVRNQSGLLEAVTDFGDEVFKSVRHAAGPLADVFMPYEGVNNYLKTVNDYDKQPTWWDRLGLLDL